MLEPIRPQDRLTSLDVLRGFALLGILLMNIQGFSMVSSAYFDPSAHMDLKGINWWIWALKHTLADQKFMAIFSILFGAGIVLATARRDSAGQRAWIFFYRRNVWLLIFGLIHAFLIWHGDILVTYAIAGFVVFWLRNFRAPYLLVFGALMLAVAPALSLLAGLAPADIQAELVASFSSSPAEFEVELIALTRSWTQGFAIRYEESLGTLTDAIPFYLFWRAGGLMLIGMALYKLDILSAARGNQFYKLLLAVGLGLGLPLVIWSVVRLNAMNWHPLDAQFGPGMLLNYVGSLSIAAAYIALLMLIVRAGVGAALQARLAAVGQMAFTNYILQSLICTFLFYGFGLGLLGQVERWGQILIVFAVWALQLVASPIWLNRFHFGPLEWLWRTLAYGKVQPFRKHHGG